MIRALLSLSRGFLGLYIYRFLNLSREYSRNNWLSNLGTLNFSQINEWDIPSQSMMLIRDRTLPHLFPIDKSNRVNTKILQPFRFDSTFQTPVYQTTMELKGVLLLSIVLSTCCLYASAQHFSHNGNGLQRYDFALSFNTSFNGTVSRQTSESRSSRSCPFLLPAYWWRSFMINIYSL